MPPVTVELHVGIVGLEAENLRRGCSPSATLTTRRSTAKRQCCGMTFAAVPPEIMPTVVVTPRA